MSAGFSTRTRCPLCRSAESERVPIPATPIHRCRDCHLCYRVEPIHPLDTPQRNSQELAAIDASRVGLFQGLVDELGAPGDDDLLIDVGASSGYFVDWASNAAWKAVGVEFGRSLAGEARDLGRCVVVGDAEAIPVRTGSAAVVTQWDVLDQIDSPIFAVAEAARILRPGGKLWLRVRNGTVHGFMRRRTWLPKKLSLLPNNLFSPRCLRKALGDAGFAPVRVVVSPTSRGDPYASMKGGGARWLRLAKIAWDYTALAVAFVSAGYIIISPSIAVLAIRTEATPKKVS